MVGLFYLIRSVDNNGPDALEMAIRAAENRIGFLSLNDEDIRDKWGRPITHRDFKQPPPEELA
jgi:hypothetical protein